MIRLVIADDHAIVRSGLGQIFAQDSGLRVVGEAANGAEVMTAVRDTDFDLLLLDINMPGISGPDLIGRVKAQRPRLPVLVLSMHNVAQVAASALRAGANGYVTKDAEPIELLGAIRTVAGHGRYIVPELASALAFSAGGNAAADELPHARLSDREFDVFRLLAAGRSSNEIADQLAISNKTVSTHKTRLMEKMNLASMADLMRYAMQHGLVS